MLNIIKGKLPRGGNEWETLANSYNQLIGDGRTTKSVKQKIYRMASTKKPTGSARLPHKVVRAMQIRDRIEMRGAVGVYGAPDEKDSSNKESENSDEGADSTSAFGTMFDGACTTSNSDDREVNKTLAFTSLNTNSLSTTSSQMNSLSHASGKTKNSRPSSSSVSHQRKNISNSFDELVTYLKTIDSNTNSKMDQLQTLLIQQLLDNRSVAKEQKSTDLSDKIDVLIQQNNDLLRILASNATSSSSSK